MKWRTTGGKQLLGRIGHSVWVRKVGLCILLYLAFVFFVLQMQITQGMASNETVALPETPAFYLGVCCFAMAVVWMVLADEMKFLFGVFLTLSMAFVFLSVVYNLLDEAAHLGVIQSLSATGHYPPLDSNYEAFQPPLYYAVSAALTFFIQGERLLVYVLRLQNVLVMAVMYFFCLKTLRLLEQSGVINSGRPISRYLLVFFCLSPAMLTRAAVVTNEIWAACSLAIVFYLLVTMVVSEQTKSVTFWLLALLSGVSLMIRISNLVILLPCICIFIYRRKYRYILPYLGVVLCVCLPWLIGNLLEYGALTGTSQHVEAAVSIINPAGTAMSWAYFVAILKIAFNGFITPQWVWLPTVTNFLNNCFIRAFWLPVVISVVLLVCFAIGFLRKRLAFEYTPGEKQKVLLMMTGVLMLQVVVVLCYMTLDSTIIYLTGRYFFPMIPALIAFFSILLGKLPKWVDYLAIPCLALFSAMLLFATLQYQLTESMLYSWAIR